MLPANALRIQEYTFEQITPQGKWSWKLRMGLTLASPTFEVGGVISPFGILRDSIPIPGDVVLAMAASIETIQTQFVPGILVGPPSSFTIVLDEGASSASQIVLVTNNGTYGSLLNASIGTSSPYVLSSIPALSGLPSGGQGSFLVTIDGSDLTAAMSPLSEFVTLSDPQLGSPVTVPLAVQVRPKATITVSPLTLNFSVVKPLSGAFPAIGTQLFQVSNTGPVGSVLNYRVDRLTVDSQTWLFGVSPSTGVLASGASENVIVSLAPVPTLLTGTYTETLRVSGYSNNSHVDVTVTLEVT